MPFWGKFTDNYGSIKTITITGFIIPIIPFIWLVTFYFKPNSFLLLFFLIGLELFAGFLWAGFNLSFSNFLYDAVSREKTHLCSAYFNILHGLGIFIGATLGGILLNYSTTLFGIKMIFIIFILSGFLRFFSYYFLIPTIKEVRDVKELTVDEAIKQLKKLEINPFLNIFELRVLKFRHS